MTPMPKPYPLRPTLARRILRTARLVAVASAPHAIAFTTLLLLVAATASVVWALAVALGSLFGVAWQESLCWVAIAAGLLGSAALATSTIVALCRMVRTAWRETRPRF